MQTISVVSQRPFDETVQRLTANVGRAEMGSFHGSPAALAVARELDAKVESLLEASAR